MVTEGVRFFARTLIQLLCALHPELTGFIVAPVKLLGKFDGLFRFLFSTLPAVYRDQLIRNASVLRIELRRLLQPFFGGW